MRHAIDALGFSLKGLAACFRTSTAFRQECLVLAAVVIVPVFAGFTFRDRFLLAAAWLGVMAVELLNSAVEEAVDMVSPQYDPKAGRAKDMASAAVLAAITANAALWLGMAWERLAA